MFGKFCFGFTNIHGLWMTNGEDASDIGQSSKPRNILNRWVPRSKSARRRSNHLL